MRRITLLASFIAVSLVSSPSRAASPTIVLEDSRGTINLYPPLASKTEAHLSPFRSKDFSLNYRPPQSAAPRLHGYLYLRPLNPAPAGNDFQLWRSFKFNGETVWNRPAIDDISPTIVKDQTNGRAFLYQDRPELIHAQSVFHPLRETVGPYRAARPGQNLIDDRAGPQK